ncbi:MAG: 4-(cytidine 5'-diphospho)-2-C-methyl-D-erythritol kinase, partial [Bacteroidales bacterium]|nr:4-(cytidine 5'-diphospho)-2-C-methyl-D-erythritol kinase [Bacteroidales bacterium]
MLILPNAKINLGLFVTEKRADGFHNIETVFYPIPLCDT